MYVLIFAYWGCFAGFWLIADSGFILFGLNVLICCLSLAC